MSDNADNSSTSATINFTNASLPVPTTLDATTEATPSGFDLTTLVFRCFAIAIGILGTVLNGAVLCGLSAKVLTKHRANWLILNQCAVDLYSSAILVVTNAFKLNQPLYRGRWGDVACVLFGSEMLIWIGLEASTAGLVCITLERYIKIIHPIWHRQHFRGWMIAVAIFLSIVDGVALEISGCVTSRVVDGQCDAYAFWANANYELASGFVVLIWTLIIPLVAFVYCYGRILCQIRKKARVSYDTQGGRKPAVDQSSERAAQSQLNIFKTLVTISVVFFVCYAPNKIYNALSTVYTNVAFSEPAYYSSVVCVFLNVCLNPFIYATRHEQLKKHMREMMCGKRNPSASGAAAATGGVATTVGGSTSAYDLAPA